MVADTIRTNFSQREPDDVFAQLEVIAALLGRKESKVKAMMCHAT